jgi:hypothetical protein
VIEQQEESFESRKQTTNNSTKGEERSCDTMDENLEASV